MASMISGFESWSSGKKCKQLQLEDLCRGLQELLRLYEGEKHMLIWRGGKGQVLLHQEAQPRDVLRPVWQVSTSALYLCEQSRRPQVTKRTTRLLCQAQSHLQGDWAVLVLYRNHALRFGLAPSIELSLTLAVYNTVNHTVIQVIGSTSDFKH